MRGVRRTHPIKEERFTEQFLAEEETKQIRLPLNVIETVPRPEKDAFVEIRKTTAVKKKPALVKEKEEVVVVPIDYKPFPHPHTPLYGDFLRWAEKGAYFILHDKHGKNGYDYRYFHKNCGGTYGSASKPDMISASQQEPVIIMDLSHYPVLMQEDEWGTVLRLNYPEYLNCVCPSHKYVLRGDGIVREYYQLAKPYFYLTGLNVVGADVDTCFHYTKLLSEVR